MEEEILEFIHRRFPIDCNWTNGNCYYFALILSARFEGDVVYDPIVGHYMFKARDGHFYDYTGRREFDTARTQKIFNWTGYESIDYLHHQHLVRDCVM